ncbi:MAG: hypothetical protein JRI99_14835 [Deltaproteobacteria bacterium]|nr:hypothetical protein [Deltaproteobacteria bacterium]
MKRILYMKLFCYFIVIISSLTLFPQPVIYAADVTLLWDASSGSHLAGYYIYYKTGTSGAPYNGTGANEGDSPIQVPLASLTDPANPEYTIHSLSDTEIYFFVAAAYDTDGNESSFSNELSYINVPASNLPPSSATIEYPDNGDYDVEMPLYITTEPFSDPNNNIHRQSRWQVSEQSDFSTLVFDVTSNNYLTTLQVPHMVLKPDQKNYVRVQFYDTYYVASEWSRSVEFTTAPFFDDFDSNGIPDVYEVDDSIDFNLDGIPDNYQPDTIKCIEAIDGSSYIGVEKISHTISEIEALDVIDPKTISDTDNRPEDLIFGLFSYRLRVNQPGDTARLRIYFSGGIFSSDIFYKYDTINSWYDYSEHTTFNDDGQSVTLSLTDGGYGDADRLANGIIVDPGGIASEGSSYTDTDSSVSDGGSGGGGGCFIATAAFGSKFEKHVPILRQFTEVYLLPNRAGRAFVDSYYKYSPPMANFIANHDTIRKTVRWCLLPIVGLSWMLLRLGVVPTLLFMVLLGVFSIGCYVKLRIGKKRITQISMEHQHR